MEAQEDEDWEHKTFNHREKTKSLLVKKQKNEYEALKTRLEKSINTKLKMRMNEYDKLLQRIQNLQNELLTKQTLHFAKIQSSNAKILAKYNLNLADLANHVAADDSVANDRFHKKADVDEEEMDPTGYYNQKKPMNPIVENEEIDMLSETRQNVGVS